MANYVRDEIQREFELGKASYRHIESQLQDTKTADFNNKQLDDLIFEATELVRHLIAIRALNQMKFLDN